MKYNMPGVKKISTTLCLLFLLAGCKSLASNMYYSELKEYKAQMVIENNYLIIRLENRPGLMVYEIDHVEKDGNLYLIANRISSGGGTKEYKIYLSWHTLPADFKSRIYWTNPDSTVNAVYPEYLK